MPVDSQAHASRTILLALQSRLVSVLGLDQQYVRIAASDAYKVSYEQTMVVIRPMSPQPYTDAGAGRRARPVSRVLRIYIHHRSSLDFVGDDSIAVPALCDIEDQVYDAMDDYWLLDDSQTVPLTIEPLHPLPSSGEPTRQPDNDIGETLSRLDFEVRYLLVNNTPAP